MEQPCTCEGLEPRAWPVVMLRVQVWTTVFSHHVSRLVEAECRTVRYLETSLDINVQ